MSSAMRPGVADQPLAVTYLILLALQVPGWVLGGLAWAVSMTVLAGWHPATAVIGGLGWAFFMWLFLGNLLTIGFVWRRSAELPVRDRAAFRAMVGRACGRLRLKVLAESLDEMILGPRRALVRFREQEVWAQFAGGVATVTGPALSLGAVRRGFVRASAESAEIDPVSVGPAA